MSYIGICKLAEIPVLGARRFKRDDGKWSLLLVLDSAGLSPMFSMLCEDLIESARNTGLLTHKSLGFVLRRLSNWRQLLERGLPDLLSENEIRGLCGELLTLKRLFLHIGKPDAVRAWVGPKGADQDFQTHNAAWEVKTIHPGATSVTISSESQLQTTSRTLFLVVIELAESGHNALETLAENNCELVFTDLAMPEMDGWETAREIRKRWPDMNVVLVTGYGTGTVPPGGEDNLVHGIIGKPFDFAQIGQTIMSIVANQPALENVVV